MELTKVGAALLLLLAMLGVTGCSDNNNNSSSGQPAITTQPMAPVETLDQQLRQVIGDNGLTGDPATGRELPDIADPLAQLGMKLFFSKALGGQTDAACVSCHHPVLGGGDDLALPIGVDAEIPDLLGPGRRHSSGGFNYDGGPTVPRNAPTTFNIALWDQVLFHDGRVESLGKTAGLNGADGAGIRTPDTAFEEPDSSAENLSQAQARFPVTSAEEMRATFGDGTTNQEIRDALASRLVEQDIPNTWLREFQSAFASTAAAAELMTFQNIALAIGEYERSQIFIDTPWRAYVQGDDQAIDEAAKRGARLFYGDPAQGGAGCAACHSGDFFTDEQFHALAMPQIGRGKGNGEFGDDDFGRYRETGLEKDRYAFRTPSLLNVTATGPWTHAGAYQTLEQVVGHHANPARAIDQYDFSLSGLDPVIQQEHAQANTLKALAQLESLQEQGQSRLASVDLDDGDVADLVAFLQALTDPCVEDRACLSRWIPDGADQGPDNLQLNAVDEDGESL